MDKLSTKLGLPLLFTGTGILSFVIAFNSEAIDQKLRGVLDQTGMLEPSLPSLQT